MTHLTIRPVLVTDSAEIFALLKQFVTSYEPSREAFDCNFPTLVSNDSTVFLAADLAGQVVGYLLGAISTTLYANGPVLAIQELMVLEKHRGKSIGRFLVEAAITKGQKAGNVEVTVPTRRACEFYLKLNFVETAVYLKRRLTAD